MPKAQSKAPKVSQTKGRTNITLRNPCILTAHQQAVKLGLIKAHSTSEWLEGVMARAIRELSPKLRRDLYRIAPELQEEVRQALAVANLK